MITKKIPRESCKKVPDIECFNVLKEVPELECTPQPYEVNEKSLKSLSPDNNFRSVMTWQKIFHI